MYSVLITVRFGGYGSVKHIANFEESVSSSRILKNINYTGFRGYELENNLYHAHYGVFLASLRNISTYSAVVKDRANSFFPDTRGEQQTDITIYQTPTELYEYCSKYKYKNPHLFVLPKMCHKTQFKLRRGFLSFS
jgi:hypothetical protein